MRFMCQPYEDDDTMTYVWSGGRTVNVYGDAADAEARRGCLQTITIEEATMKSFHESMMDHMKSGLRYD